MTSGFGARLREQRERQQVDLRAIAVETKISESLLEALERDDVSRWPNGIFRRAFVRAYAQSIGLNPDEVVREFLEHFPDPLEGVDTVVAVAQATGTAGPPARGVVRWFRSSEKPGKPQGLGLRGGDAPSAPAQTVSGARPAVQARAEATEPNLSVIARLCTALGRVLPTGEARPILEEASRAIGAAGLLVWQWEPQRSVLQASIGHGYSEAVIAHLPAVTRDDDNAVAAAFRAADTFVVNGDTEMTGAVAVPLLASTGCVGVLALEFRNGGEQLESVRAVATMLAAQLVHLIPHIR